VPAPPRGPPGRARLRLLVDPARQLTTTIAITEVFDLMSHIHPASNGAVFVRSTDVETLGGAPQLIRLPVG
jgi:hypothetical protein